MDDLLQRTELQPGIVELRMNRPARLNALNAELITELVRQFEALNAERRTRVVILTGAGKGFCAGADLQAPAEPGSLPGTTGLGDFGFVYKYQEYLSRMVLAVHECEKPVIAAVNGAAVGGGLGLSLACDIRIASNTAIFANGAVKTGLSGCDAGISYFLPRLVGAGMAAELMLTGRRVPGPEARELGLCSRVVEPGDLDSAALAMALAVAENAEFSSWMTKKTLWGNLDATSLRQALELENRTQVLGTFTGGMAAMREAFSSGKQPQWKTL